MRNRNQVNQATQIRAQIMDGTYNWQVARITHNGTTYGVQSSGYLFYHVGPIHPVHGFDRDLNTDLDGVIRYILNN